MKASGDLFESNLTSTAAKDAAPLSADDLDVPTPLNSFESFESICRREQRGLTALAFALTGSWAAAEDIAQDALIALNRDWQKVSEYESPIGWTRRVVANRSTSLIRKRVSEAKALGHLGRRRPEEQDPSMPSESEHLWEAIRSLPKRQAQVVTLQALHSLSLREIGDVLEISKSSVQTHLTRARRTLSSQLGLDPSS